MAFSKDQSATQHYYNNMQEVLTTQLEKARQQSPESFLKPIHVLPAIYDNVKYQFEQELKRENQEHTGERIILIPYFFENSYWIGILIEFKDTGLILRAEYINPVNESNIVPHILQKQFTGIYPTALLQTRNLSKHNDRSLSATLTIKNLIDAAGNQTSTYTTGTKSQNWLQKDKTSLTSATHISTTGNEHTLQELEQKFYRGLTKWKVKDAIMLSKEIQKTVKQIDKYEEEEKTQDFQREKEKLSDLKDLQYLWNRISVMKESRVCELEEKLKNGLIKFKLQNDIELAREIRDTEERIQILESRGRKEKAEIEKKDLFELQELQKILNEIDKLKNTASASSDDRNSEVHELKEKLNDGLAKLKLQSVDELDKEIQDTQDRIQGFESRGRHDKAQTEKDDLLELQELKKISDKIIELNSSKSPSASDPKENIHELQERLNDRLAKLKLQSVDELDKEIQDTQDRIQGFESRGRHDKAQIEKDDLLELQELKKISDKIIELNSSKSPSASDPKENIHELQERLNDRLAKLKLQSVDELDKEIQDTQDRIQGFESRGRHDKAQTEKDDLLELQELKKISDKIIELNSSQSPSVSDPKENIHELQEKLNNGLAKLKLRNVDELDKEIQDTQDRIQGFESRGRHDKAQAEKDDLLQLQELKKISDKLVELTSWKTVSISDPKEKLRELQEKFNNGLSKLKLQNVDELEKEIQATQGRIQSFESRGRQDKAQTEKDDLLELEELYKLWEEICKLIPIVPPDPIPVPPVPDVPPLIDPNIVPDGEKHKKLLQLQDLSHDSDTMPPCAGKIILKLLVHYEQRLLGVSLPSENQDSISSFLQQLPDQLKREELLSENTKAILSDLYMHTTNDNCSLIVRCLSQLLKKIRVLNVPEIQRLVSKAKEAADLIRDKDIILLIGPTGAGKSTTIQFLAGATMKATKVEVNPGKYLDHVTAVGPLKNSDLTNVISSPLQKSETRYIAPVTVQLKDILGPHETGVITLCDAPGFGDTAGPEVDIANSIGVIEALKGTKSVKLLVLSSYMSLSDRGQGIQKLAHILISMVQGIDDKLDAIFYGFTKYPETKDINALLLDIKRSKVDEDPTLNSDTAFVTVLKDMIEKTEDGADKIEPTKDEPKKLIKRLRKIHGIKNPGEVFQFSMSEETRASIVDHVQRDKFSIICAMKHKDNSLVLFYLNDLSILKELIKESFIQDAYEKAVRFVSEDISKDCTEIMEKFNRALASQDGLEDKDILDYQTCVANLQDAKILKEHLGSYLLSPAALIQNIIAELHKISRNLDTEKLHSPLWTIYLDNLRMLKKTFRELEENYNTSCQTLENRFDNLVKAARKLIPKTNFKEIAENLGNIYQSVRNLEDHLHGQILEAYTDTVKYLLQYLDSFSDKIEPLLAKVRLSNEEVEIIKNYTEILRSAKENAALQEHVSTYTEILKKKTEVSDEYDGTKEKIKDLNEIYNDFIVEIIKYFDQINLRIKELFEKNGDHALEHVKSLVNDMDALRTIPELESKTAGTYYHTVENIRGYMQQLQKDAESLLTAIDQQSGITNYRHLARSLSRLKNAEWINQVSPGTYDNLMRRITEELVQYAGQLEDNLKRIDFSLKYPENVPVATEIVAKIESMRDLERSVPDLEIHRKNILERFSQCIQTVFDRIQNTFNLQDRDVYFIKQELQKLEDIKREYENLHPARTFLRQQGYVDFNMVNNEIEELKAKQKIELESADIQQNDMESKLNSLNEIVQKYMELSVSSSQQTMRRTLTKAKNKILGYQANPEAESYLETSGYSSIEEIHKQIKEIQDLYRTLLQKIEDQKIEFNNSLHRLEGIKRDYDSLLTTHSSASSENISFLREKGFSSYELLNEAIQEQTRVINERNKNKQTYHFNDRLDVAAANNAIVYISQCEKVNYDHVRENAIDANDKIRKYIQEYGIFLKQEINRKFNLACRIDDKDGPFLYSQDLEMRLHELLSCNKFTHVSEFINASETIEKLHQEFLDFHNILSVRMEEYKISGKLKELRDQLIIVQALTSVDRFCANIFAGNGFGALYKQYQGEITKECRVAYKTVLDYISNKDYANADIALSDINDNPLNPRDEMQIQHDLQCSLNKLMKDTRSIANWLDGKIEREKDNRDQIRDIKENIDKIRIALSKRSIMKLLDSVTQENLRSFEKEINDLLAETILKGLRSIAAFMDIDSFSDAEQGMENLSRVQRELAGYCVSDKVKTTTGNLNERLGNIVSEILKRSDFADINTYSTNPPKDLLNRLEKVASHGNAKFTQAYTSMLAKIRQTFNLAIEQVRKAPFNERAAKIRSLNYALHFLPDDLQKQYNLQIEELTKLFDTEAIANKENLEKSMADIDSNEHTIAEVGLLAARYSEQKMYDLLKTLREECLKKLHMHRTDAQKFLDEQKIQSAINTFKRILKYEECVGTYIPEIKGICDNFRDIIIKRFSNCCDTLGNIASNHQTQIVEKAFDDMLIYLAFSNTSNKRIEEFFPEVVLKNVKVAFQKICQFFNENYEKFKNALKDMNIVELHKTISVSEKWQKFLEKISECTLNHSLIQNLLRDVRNIVSFGDMIIELEQAITHLKSQVDIELISDETTKFEGRREELFRNLMGAFDTLKAINTRFRDILSSPIDLETHERNIKIKVDNIKQFLFNKALKEELSATDTDDFRMYYNHLLSIAKYVRLPSIDTRQVLEESRDKVLARVDSLYKQIKDSISNVKVVSTVLVKIKFLAENLSMFEKHINDRIDSILKIYKENQGADGINRLSIELERTDVGGRLISEHSILSGEDWRKRREKMQYQDDLEYILKRIGGGGGGDGDDLEIDILRKRYKAYRQKYDELLSTFLNSLQMNEKDEPDLEVLVTQTKLLVGTIPRDANSVTWPRTFRDNIPELLAHIFAIWTLKNTQYFNAMRGIEKDKSYLLMPHVGQVIAIFRLLGIGFKKSKKPPVTHCTYKRIVSEDLVNNLVEVGTGEGKSVVMAVTACVFALTGVDVNCSCYSEILSTRDKNDFGSVFRTLGIEDRIEYGTFNKLCEQLLNEQCNVREKVRDMILTNQNTLSKIDTSTRARPKALLIDEVDVFLSDKYYGGMYVPSVWLKDSSIKALLDSIWENKTCKSLNAVKALPAYTTCATKYSNWIFLFDEAIKDMIAALQSDQLSTHLVRNDKIVYVDGESIVDNVVRGYDTVWAYYHENSKGNISIISLQENVGILINCGTFSYAEMPHDFAYIGGVTGTLKTLADVEKGILEKVYAINKTTFMPSVFASGNRTYNKEKDVRVVKESEFYMQIRGEIDVMCNANRAILVFFESENELMTFYKSPELSAIKKDVQIITEEVSVKDRELFVKRAATLNKVTLLTRTFGRGTDFICRNQQLLGNGGIHVLQTFFSEELSEEYQIMGRGARQGDRGSYRMILRDKDLEWVLGSDWSTRLPKIIGDTFYDTLNESRKKLYEGKCGAKAMGIEQCKADHNKSKAFMNSLTKGEIENVKTFLAERNKGVNLITASSRTVLLMDATGSMSGLLSAAKETVCTMFERTAAILLEKKLPNDAFQMQFVVYRDYDCKEKGLLESSPWETRPSNLRTFMTTISATGGGDYEEAIEIGLWYSVQQSEKPDGISQVILIGDAPAKDEVAIKRDRDSYGGDAYWNKTAYGTSTYYKKELQKLKAKNIPVHAFYLAEGAKNNFEEIARETAGRCKHLNIHSSEGAESLTNFVTEEILRKTAGDQGEAAVALYRKRYIEKTYT